MKKICLYLTALFILIFYYSISYASDDTRSLISQEPPAAQRQQSPQGPQTTKPILPPTVPFSSVVSPTPSPHIAAPLVNPPPIATPISATDLSFPKTSIHTMPSVSVQAAVPAMSGPIGLPQQVPIIGNSIGKVTDIGIEEDGSHWIQVRDGIFDEILKIKVDSEKTIIIKKTAALSFEDIKTEDMVSVIFNQQGEEILANFVSILTEEDLKIMEESLESQSTLVPAEGSSSSKE